LTQEEATESRSSRAQERRVRRRTVGVRAAVGIAAALLLAGAGLGAYRYSTTRVSAAAPPLASVATSVTTAAAAPVTNQVEVPSLVGMPLAQAKAIVEAAGLSALVDVDASAPSSPGQGVRSQRPAAGAVVSAGTALTLAVGPAGKGASGTKPGSGGYVVVIDPGHQSHGNAALEPIGPGSKQTQPKATAGSTGVTTGVPEHEINLQIATNLQNKLEAAGVRVVMTRTTNDVDISNAQRAAIANAEKANLFLRIHADSSAVATATGVSTLYPASNQWTKTTAAASKKAGMVIQANLVSETGARDNGALQRDDIAGFNWAKVPSVLVEAGYQSNPVEDRLLASSRYQDQVAQGIADGVLSFLSGGR
jgi:N-acetylmuramoyl-L-alanine amidase